jgi:hypothetical protein
VRDVGARLIGRVQSTSDVFNAYENAVEAAFGGDVDFAMLIKIYGATGPEDQRRYSRPECIGCQKRTKVGNPDPEHISTSYMERQNLTLRMSSRRMTRLTNAFSKKLANHRYEVALHYLYYNHIRKHMTLKTTPAVAAGIATAPLTMIGLMQMIEQEEAKVGGQLTDYLPSPDTDSK